MRKRVAGLALAALGFSGAASAEVTGKAPDGMTIHIVVEAKMDRDAMWARLVDPSLWWNPAHSYSGEAKSLSLDAQAGGCWCEMWNGGEVEHGRVIMVMPKETLRLDAPLGPLQALGVQATLTFTLEDGKAAGATKLTVDYHVSGSSLSGLDQLAAPVDGVLTEQVTRLASGK